MNGNIQDKLKCAFEMYDLNGNGRVGRREMKIIVDMIFELIGEDKTNVSNKKVQMIFEKMDKDKDGYITMNEFIEGCTKNDYLKEILNASDAMSDTSSYLSSHASSTANLSISSSMTSATRRTYSFKSMDLIVLNDINQVEMLTPDERLCSAFLPKHYQQRLIE
jgi:hypothetical protein